MPMATLLPSTSVSPGLSVVCGVHGRIGHASRRARARNSGLDLSVLVVDDGREQR